MTLQCHSQTLSDTFYLHKEGSPAPPQHFRPPDTAASFQANFTMNPVTSAHGGTYRCYSSWSTSPYLLSHLSDPVEFVVSGEWPQPHPLYLMVSSGPCVSTQPRLPSPLPGVLWA